MLTGHQELERFLDKRTTLFTKAIRDIYRARYGGGDSKHPIADLSELISHTMILADLNGRKRVLMEADQARKRKGMFAEDATPITPLPFEEAIDDILTREPRLAPGYKAVQSLYNTSHTFALAKSVNQNLTERIQKAIADLQKTGEGLPKFTEVWREIAPWSEAYAGTVYRTNAATSYSNGRFVQAKDKDVAEVIPAMIFINMHLPNSRPNHEAADGLIAATDDPIWGRFKPPLGYNCRCGTNFVSKYELERRGLIIDGKVQTYYPANFGSAHPDHGFNG
jgi:SPP1 gp7 family putative phage head morphogenesis protein